MKIISRPAQILSIAYSTISFASPSFVHITLHGEDALLSSSGLIARESSSIEASSYLSHDEFDSLLASASTGSSVHSLAADHASLAQGGEPLKMIDPNDCSWQSSDAINIVGGAIAGASIGAGANKVFFPPVSAASAAAGAALGAWSAYQGVQNQQVQCQFDQRIQQQNNTIQQQNNTIQQQNNTIQQQQQQIQQILDNQGN